MVLCAYKGDDFTLENNHVEFYQKIKWQTELFTESNAVAYESSLSYCSKYFASLINRDSCDMSKFERTLHNFSSTSEEVINKIIDEVIVLDKVFRHHDSSAIGDMMKKRFLYAKKSLENFFKKE